MNEIDAYEAMAIDAKGTIFRQTDEAMLSLETIKNVGNDAGLLTIDDCEDIVAALKAINNIRNRWLKY